MTIVKATKDPILCLPTGKMSIYQRNEPPNFVKLDFKIKKSIKHSGSLKVKKIEFSNGFYLKGKKFIKNE